SGSILASFLIFQRFSPQIKEEKKGASRSLDSEGFTFSKNKEGLNSQGVLLNDEKAAFHFFSRDFALNAHFNNMGPVNRIYPYNSSL
ncbi:MAG: hypothetical protein D6797_00355, partial [Bdellovibrio sp.]